MTEVIERLTEIEEKVALQRKWYHCRPGVVPEDMASLRQLIPSGLTEDEKTEFLRGSLGEAKWEFIKVFNTSWTKTEMNARVLKEGLIHALESWDDKTRQDLERAIRLLSD